jgi:hypothetical protein
MAKSKENIIMNNNNNLGFDINAHRASLEAFAPYFGKKIFAIKSDNLDLSHNEKVLNDTHPRLARPFKKYFVEDVEITSMEIKTNANGKPVVEFNHKASLQFPITAPKFEKATSDKVEEAIKNPDSNIFFTDYKELVDVVTAYNKQVMEDIDSLSKQLIEWSNALRTINENEKFNCERYYKSLDRKA